MNAESPIKEVVSSQYNVLVMPAGPDTDAAAAWDAVKAACKALADKRRKPVRLLWHEHPVFRGDEFKPQ